MGSIDWLIGLKSTWLTVKLTNIMFRSWSTTSTMVTNTTHSSILHPLHHSMVREYIILITIWQAKEEFSPKVNCFYSQNWHFISSSVLHKNLVRFPLNLYCMPDSRHLKENISEEAQSFLLLSSFLNSSYPLNRQQRQRKSLPPLSLSVFPLYVKVLPARLYAQPKGQGWTQTIRQQNALALFPFINLWSVVGTFPEAEFLDVIKTKSFPPCYYSSHLYKWILLPSPPPP
jgi:hypothetical protein